MPGTIGQPVGSLKALKAKLAKKGGGGSSFIKYVPKNGSVMVRFLTEPDGFVGYDEGWSGALRRSFPVTSDMKEGRDYDRKSFVYICNALDCETDKVIPFQLKQSVVNTLVIKYERNDTIMDRDYEISRYGEGLDTTYDVESEPPKKRVLTKYKLLDLEQILQDAVKDAVAPADDDDDDKTLGSGDGRRPKRQRRVVPSYDEDEITTDDDDEEDDEPDEYTVAQMKAMDWADLKEYAKELGLKVTTRKRAELISAIVRQQDADSLDDEEPF